MLQSPDVPNLAPPGAGLPWIQSAFGRYLWLPYLAAVSSWERSAQRFQDEGRRVLSMIAGLDEERMRRRVLVHGIIGIEDSSRFWSPAMVLEHLVITGDMAADILVALAQNRVPEHNVRIAALKPSGAWPPGRAVEEFKAMLARYERRTRDEATHRDSERRWNHPWFGELTAHEWHCLAGLHQGLHRRQMQAIVAAAQRLQNSKFGIQNSKTLRPQAFTQ